MSFIPSPSNPDQDQPLLADKHENAFEALGHDGRNAATSNMAGTGGGTATDISASQKMISATWGSILTSLLGKTLIVFDSIAAITSDAL
jgi:hypothetical protein